MKRHLYKVYFKNEDVSAIMIRAFNKKEAEILSQAELIKKGLDYRIQRIELIDQ